MLGPFRVLSHSVLTARRQASSIVPALQVMEQELQLLG